MGDDDGVVERVYGQTGFVAGVSSTEICGGGN